MSLNIDRETVTRAVGVILRVPSLFIAEAWFRTSPRSMENFVYAGKGKDIDPTHHVAIKTLYYGAILLAATLSILPVKRLVTLYMYLLSAGLLAAAHYSSLSFVTSEKRSADSPYDNTEFLQRIGCHMIAQCFIGASISYLISLRHWSRIGLMIYTAPMIARMVNFPIDDLHRVHNFAAMFNLVVAIFYIFHKLPLLFDFIKMGIKKVTLTVQLYGWIPYLMAMWFNVLLPVQFLIFWVALLVVQMAKYLSVTNHPILVERWFLVLMATVSECCVTPISLLGLCFTVSYVAFGILSITKIYLEGRGGFMHDNVMHRGWTEGCTMFLLSIQTRMIELKSAQRAFLMSIVLFIVCSSLIQSMYEITEPFLLELSASQNKSVSKHIRAVVLCTFLWMFPLFMTYSICQYFDLDFWLLVVISSCVLTSVQVLGSLVVYALFMYDAISRTPWERLDDVVYYAKSTTRVLEFIVAVFVVAYGVKESILGEWSWINSSILVVHCYFNVWQRLQAGWKSYLLRREAVKKIESLPMASEEQLSEHNDVCPICFQQLLASACITPCNHFFHTFCLKKWLYVQDSCPFCHQKINISDTGETEKDGQNEGEARGMFQAEGWEGEDIAENGSHRGEGDGSEGNTEAGAMGEASPELDIGKIQRPGSMHCTSHVRTNSEIRFRENYVFVESSEEVEGHMQEEENEGEEAVDK